MAQGKAIEAIPHFERVIALKPDLVVAYEDLGRAYAATGQLNAAIDALSRALSLRETPQGKALFAQCVKFMRFAADDARMRKLLVRALREGWSAPRELTGTCISLIKLNPAVKNGVARINASWPVLLSAAELLGPTGLTEISNDELLCCLLERDPLPDIGLERLLSNIRTTLLTRAEHNDEDVDEQLLQFYGAIARQCFINAYIYPLSQAESGRAHALQSALAKAIEDSAPIPALWPIAVGAYAPLHTLPKADALLKRSWPGCVNALLVQQIEEPAEERRIAATIPALTGIDGDVSRAVRQQYEENPYPRWVGADAPATSTMSNERQPAQTGDVLIAGCGTGLSAIEFARHARGMRIVAIDLSLASLSYAKRMARQYDFTNIEFGHADITKLASIGRTFDLIDASGVLHHLADPWEGWRILLSLLRPGGVMQVGLYSDLGRPGVVAARQLIADRHYRPTLDDIRHCREDLVAASDPILKSVTQWEDFYSTDECRDLLFHVQEHRIALGEIKSFLAENRLEFLGFLLDPATLQRFTTRFPERVHLTDLDCWHAYETEAPLTFAGMYQFRVRKPAAGPDKATRPA